MISHVDDIFVKIDNNLYKKVYFKKIKIMIKEDKDDENNKNDKDNKDDKLVDNDIKQDKLLSHICCLQKRELIMYFLITLLQLPFF